MSRAIPSVQWKSAQPFFHRATQTAASGIPRSACSIRSFLKGRDCVALALEVKSRSGDFFLTCVGFRHVSLSLLSLPNSPSPGTAGRLPPLASLPRTSPVGLLHLTLQGVRSVPAFPFTMLVKCSSWVSSAEGLGTHTVRNRAATAPVLMCLPSGQRHTVSRNPGIT